MTDVSKVRPQTTAGLDLGDKYSYLCLVDQESGEIVEEGRLRTNPETFKRRFASELPPMRIAIEAGTHSPWASRVLEECGHEVLVANARKLRLIYANKRKTDEIDAENLARLARVDPKLLYPLKHRGEEAQAHMAIVRSREALVDSRTQLVNHVRGAVKSFGARLPKCPAVSFHNKAPEHIPEALLPALGPLLETIGSLTRRIREYDRRLEAIAKGHQREDSRVGQEGRPQGEIARRFGVDRATVRRYRKQLDERGTWRVWLRLVPARRASILFAAAHLGSERHPAGEHERGRDGSGPGGRRPGHATTGAYYLGSHKWVFGLKGGRSEASVRMRMPLRSGVAVRLQGGLVATTERCASGDGLLPPSSACKQSGKTLGLMFGAVIRGGRTGNCSRSESKRPLELELGRFDGGDTREPLITPR